MNLAHCSCPFQQWSSATMTQVWSCAGIRAGPRSRAYRSLILTEVAIRDVSLSRPSIKEVLRAPTPFARVNGIHLDYTPTYNRTYTQQLISPAFTHEQSKPWKRSLDPALHLPSHLTPKDKDNRLTGGRRDIIPLLPQSFIPNGR